MICSMPSKPETIRGQCWARKLAALGCWVQKLHGSAALAGLPDYIVGDTVKADGVRFVEAKTLEAVVAAKERIPANACSRAQVFFLDQVVRCGGRASLLVLGVDRYVELDWVNGAKLPMSPAYDLVRDSVAWRY